MDYHILSLEKAISYQPTKPTVMIRALEPRNEIPPLLHQDSFVDVLELVFDDLTEEDWSERSLQGSNFKLFSAEQALETLRFFEKHRNIDSIVFHCHEGRSRSSALAISFAHFIGNDSMIEEIELSRKYTPNPTVIKRFLNQWRN